MAAVEIGQLPLTTAVLDLTQIPVENANITQKIEAYSLKSYMTTLPSLTVSSNITGTNLLITGKIDSSTVVVTGNVNGAVLVSTTTGLAPFNVASSIQVPNLYASRAAIADATTNGLTITSSFANTSVTDVTVSGNNSTISANLRTVNTNIGTFGNTVTVPQLTVDAKGRITAVSNVAITFPSQTLISNTSEITANTVSGAPGLSLTTTGVSAGTYGGAINVPQITVDAKGRVTNITSIPVNSTLNTLNIGIPIGTIALWSGPLGTIPDGWQLADGSNGTVDLRDRFVVGAGSTYGLGATGGSADAVVVSHTHAATSTSTFTGSALPTHTHGIIDPGHTHKLDGGTSLNPGIYIQANPTFRQADAFTTKSSTTGISINAQTAGTPTGTVATSTTVSTEGSSATDANLPPYYALYYIQKMTDAVSINNPINYMATLGNIIAGGNLVAASGNVSISTTTGALVVVGGAGISGNLNVGSTITTPTMPPGTANTAVATTAFVSAATGSLGTISTQNANNVSITGGTISGMSSVADSIGNLRNLPVQNKTSSYVLATSDVGQVISITTGGVTVPSGVFSSGQSISVYNNSGSSQTITQGSGTTMTLVSSGLTGNRTLGGYGLCTVLCIGANTFVVIGSGLS